MLALKKDCNNTAMNRDMRPWSRDTPPHTFEKKTEV